MKFIRQKSQYSFCISLNPSQNKLSQNFADDFQIRTYPVFYDA